ASAPTASTCWVSSMWCSTSRRSEMPRAYQFFSARIGLLLRSEPVLGMADVGHFRLPTARLRSCSGASADPQKADHIRAPALVVSRVPEPEVTSPHIDQESCFQC